MKVKILKFRSLKDLPELAGWVTFGEAARDLDVTSERIRQMAQEGKLTTAHRIGRRPVGIMKESELRDMLLKREEAASARQEAAS